MLFKIAERQPTEKELNFVNKNLTEVKRMLANLHTLKIKQKELKTDLTEEIKSVQNYLKEIFGYIVDLQY
jgi:hypothetical protein